MFSVTASRSTDWLLRVITEWLKNKIFYIDWLTVIQGCALQTGFLCECLQLTYFLFWMTDCCQSNRDYKTTVLLFLWHTIYLYWLVMTKASNLLPSYDHSSDFWTSYMIFQLIALPGSAQAKIEDVSRLFLNHVSQMPMNVPMIQVVNSPSVVLLSSVLLFVSVFMATASTSRRCCTFLLSFLIWVVNRIILESDVFG